MSAEVVSVVERRFAFWPKLLDHLRSRKLPATPLPAPKKGNESLLLEGQKRWYRLFVRLMPSTGRVEVGIHLPATNQHFGDASAYLYRNGEALGAAMEGDVQVSPSLESYSRHYIELRRQEFRRIMLEERATDFAMLWIGDKISRVQEFIGAHRDFLDAKRLTQTDEHIRTLVESLLPDVAKRRTCLSIFAESIAKLHTRSPSLWGVYATHDRVQLLGGNLIVCAIRQGGIWLGLDAEAIDSFEVTRAQLAALRSWTPDAVSYPQYVVAPTRNGTYVPTELHAGEWPHIKALHHLFLDRGASKYRSLNVRSQKKHQPVVLAYLRQELQRPLPDPNYAASERPAPIVPALETPRLPEELPNSDNLYEGSKTQIMVNAYERNKTAREICLSYWGTVCAVCNLDLAERYGEVARGLVHVHHLIKISDVAEPYQVDPVADLRPVCPNCHAVIHRRSEPYTLEEVRQFLASAPIAQASEAMPAQQGPAADGARSLAPLDTAPRG